MKFLLIKYVIAAKVLSWSDAVEFHVKSLGMLFSVITASEECSIEMANTWFNYYCELENKRQEMMQLTSGHAMELSLWHIWTATDTSSMSMDAVVLFSEAHMTAERVIIRWVITLHTILIFKYNFTLDAIVGKESSLPVCVCFCLPLMKAVGGYF